jgi:hypothetical protein
MLRDGFSPMLLELQVRQVYIHILLVIWGLAELLHNPNLLHTSSCSYLLHGQSLNDEGNGGNPLQHRMVMGMALHSSKQW